MKILVLGLDNSILDKNSSLAKRAVEYGGLVQEYTVIVPAKKDEIVGLSENVKVYGAQSKNKIFGLFRIYKLAEKIIKENDIDVISAQDQYYLGFIALLLARRHSKGIEIQVHGFEKYGGLRKMITKYVLPRADSVRVVSRRLKKGMVEEFGVGKERIIVVPIHIRIRNQESGIRNYARGDNDKFVFLTVGRLVPVKNIEMQIEAMSKITKKHSNIELWIIGDGPERGNLEFGIRNLGLWIIGDGQEKEKLQANIKFLGWHNDLENFYRKADAFLLTSNYEGWGMVAIEAASYGLPIIMTDVGCAGEIIKNGESGIVISVGDQKELEGAMIKLIEDKNLREELGKNARETVKNLPSKEETLNLYKKSWELALNKK